MSHQQESPCLDKLRGNNHLPACTGHHGNYRQGDTVSADIREETIQPVADNIAMTTTSSLDAISEDDHVMPAPPPPTSTVTLYQL